ncbi:hypothetical protein PMI07_000903 [Rhizobium sp. CF080]|uniref:hypothetical protein n=1 Tax=Rhizobium sp. (strain CF080) TaxID=1144310 RepID=UPI000271B4BC|nr:hypothetical protein [Rhizobium sp. CF080]EUB97327.1 hypothetical protein PMI07_000903 [Rhizobium sp. CF080]
MQLRKSLSGLGSLKGLPSLAAHVSKGGGGRVLRIAATLGRISGTNVDGGNDGTNTQHISRNVHRTGKYAVSGLRLVAGNVKLPGVSPFGELGVGNAVTYQSEIELAGVNTVAKWGGANSLSVPDKSIGISDPIMDLPAGQVFYTRHWTAVADATKNWPRAQSISANGQRAIKGTDLSSYFSGTGTLVGGTTDAPHPPLALLGMVPRDSVAVAYTGTSIEDGNGDLTTLSPDGAVAYIGRGLENVNGFNLPSCKMSRGGENLQGLADPVSGAIRRSMLQYATHFICGSPTNDMLVSLARTIAAIQQDFMTVWMDAWSKGVQEIWQVNIIPRTNSSNVPLTNYEANGTSHRDVLNNWFVNECVNNGWITGVINFAADCEDPVTRGTWKAGFTSDWTHPLDQAHTLGAARVNAIASNWTAH